VHKRRRNIGEGQRVVILSALVGNNPRVAAPDRTKLVRSGIGDPRWQGESESLNGNDVKCIDQGVAIDSGRFNRRSTL